jgi:alpha-1,3-rhamnosyltransferase
MNNDPLVSIVVITYNAEKFIIECLDSIQSQTYKNIELIISDDSSQDSTVAMCKNWLVSNTNRFVAVKLIESPVNTGITKNINRGCKVAKGEWIKPLAGDDLLLPLCIEENIEHCDKKQIIFSQAEIFDKDTILGYLPCENNKSFFNLDAKKQFQKLFLNSFLPAPTSFINHEYLKNMNYFNEKYAMVEDYPFYLESTFQGTKLYYFDKITVRYRKHTNSISNNVDFLHNVTMHKIEKTIIYDMIKRKGISICLKINRIVTLYEREIIIKRGNSNEAHNKYRFIKYLNPCKYLEKIKWMDIK